MPFGPSGITVNGGAAAVFRNSIVDDGCDQFPVYDGDVIGNAYNLERGNTCGFSGTDVSGVDPLLGPLQNNGGPTFTHALPLGSPAIDAGSSALPGSGGTACEANDQRGVSRPQRTRCDIGSVETDPCPPSPLAGCLTSAKSLFLIKDRNADGASAKDKLIWKFIKGDQTSLADFSNPQATASYALCIYGGTSGALVATASVPPSPTLWSPIGTKGYKYKDQSGSQSGIQKIILKSGMSAKSYWERPANSLRVPAPVPNKVRQGSSHRN